MFEIKRNTLGNCAVNGGKQYTSELVNSDMKAEICRKGLDGIKLERKSSRIAKCFCIDVAMRRTAKGEM